MRTGLSRTNYLQNISAKLRQTDAVVAPRATPSNDRPSHDRPSTDRPGPPLALALRPPPLPPGCIERQHDRALQNRIGVRQLTAVIAPAGSGKTTLLIQWYRSLPRRCARAWLTLDRFVRGPATLFMHFDSALQAAGLLPRASFAPLTGELHAHAFCARLAQLASAHAQLHMVVDDIHHLATPELADELAYVLRHSPNNVRWVLAGRALPAVNAAEFALRGELSAVDGAQLDFDPKHIARAALELDCREFDDDDAQRIYTSTEGWIAGVRFALLATQRRSAAPAEDADAFFTALLGEQPSELREVLLATSLVEVVDPDLCNSMLGIEAAHTLLQRLEQSNLFVRRVDGNALRLRLHPLFRHYLQRCLRNQPPERLADLHLRASRWYAHAESFADALMHAFASGRREWCVHLTASAARHWVKCGAIAQALSWTERFHRDELFSHEHLWTAHVTCLILSRRFANAADELADATKRGAATDKVRTLKLMLALLSNRSADLRTEGDADDVADSAGLELTGTLMSLQAYWLYRHERFDAARRRALQAREWLESSGSLYGATHANAVLCASLGALNHNRLAVEHGEYLFARVANGQRNPAWANAATTLAQIRYEQNRLFEAGELCREALPLLSNVSALQGFTAAHIVWARVQAAAGRVENSQRLLDDLHGYVETGRFPLLLAHVCFEKIRLHVHLDRCIDLDTTAAEFDLDGREARGEWQAGAASDATSERLGCAQALRLLHVGRYDRCRALIGALSARATRAGYGQRVVFLAVLRALVSWRTQDHSNAYRALHTALKSLEGIGFTRSHYDDAPGLDRLLALAVTSGKLPGTLPRDYFTKYASVLGDIAPPGRSNSRRAGNGISVTPLEPLTDRETNVLRLLALGLSNQEICARSNIAITTTKWHLKNIFAKLDVGSRTAALARARALRLID